MFLCEQVVQYLAGALRTGQILQTTWVSELGAISIGAWRELGSDADVIAMVRLYRNF